MSSPYGGSVARPPPGRIVRASEFEAILGSAARARSEHFALHQMSSLPPGPARLPKRAQELSTPGVTPEVRPVDDSKSHGPLLGLVVPKRHARRAVTRTLLKRQIRAAMLRHCAAASTGWWVVRLRRPYALTLFPSAASVALKHAVADELDGLFAAAVRKLGALSGSIPNAILVPTPIPIPVPVPRPAITPSE